MKKTHRVIKEVKEVSFANKGRWKTYKKSIILVCERKYKSLLLEKSSQPNKDRREKQEGEGV